MTMTNEHLSKRPESRSNRRTVGRPILALGLGLAAALSGALTVAVPAGAATPSYQGPATLANQTTSGSNSGGSTDLFTLNLPALAACPGDSTTGGYLVDSYLVPQSTNFGTLSFSGGFPSTGYSLYNSSSNKAFAAANTATGTGQVIGIPQTLELGAQVGHSKPTLTNLLGGTGVWEVGIACELSGALTSYWNAEVTFTASASDPDGFTWAAVPGPQTPPAVTPEVPYALILPLLGAGIIGGILLIRRRRSLPTSRAGV
jgi:hypothetical protein